MVDVQVAQRVAVVLDAEVDDVRAAGCRSGRQMPLRARLFQPVPLPSASVPAPPAAAPGSVLPAPFWRLSSLR